MSVDFTCEICIQDYVFFSVLIFCIYTVFWITILYNILIQVRDE